MLPFARQCTTAEAVYVDVFPEYSALVNPQPLKADEVQQSLRSDEALVFWLPGTETTYVFALTREDLHALKIGRKQLTERISGLRRGIDADVKAIRGAALFDLGEAHALY
jgi:hypothetical protein